MGEGMRKREGFCLEEIASTNVCVVISAGVERDGMFSSYMDLRTLDFIFVDARTLCRG